LNRSGHCQVRKVASLLAQPLSRFFALHVWVLPAAIAPLVLLRGAVLVLKHGVFGSEMEYRDRIARLRERRRLEGYGRYEEDEEGSRD
jgi:menaquinol-cytochrome c reductase cytochrome b subunit